MRRDEAGIWENRCGRKRRHPTKDDAVAEAARLTEKEHTLIVAYACAGCGGFHVGHPPPQFVPAQEYLEELRQ